MYAAKLCCWLKHVQCHSQLKSVKTSKTVSLGVIHWMETMRVHPRENFGIYNQHDRLRRAPMQLIQGNRTKCETRSVIDGDWGSSVLNAKGSWWLMVAFGLLPTGRGNPAGGHLNLANSCCLTRRVAPRDIYQRKNRKGWWMLGLLGGGSALYILFLLEPKFEKYVHVFVSRFAIWGILAACSELAAAWHSFKSMRRISCRWRQPRPIRTELFPLAGIPWLDVFPIENKENIYKKWLPDVSCVLPYYNNRFSKWNSH